MTLPHLRNHFDLGPVVELTTAHWKCDLVTAADALDDLDLVAGALADLDLLLDDPAVGDDEHLVDAVRVEQALLRHEQRVLDLLGGDLGLGEESRLERARR